MTDPPSFPGPRGDTGDGIGVGSERRPGAGTPRWVYLFGVIALVLVLLIAIVMLTGAGGHGPSRHAPSDDTGRPASSPSIREYSGRQP
jgi:hypothetical protein